MKKLVVACFLMGSFFGLSQSYSVNTNSGQALFNYVSESTKGSIGEVQAKINIDAGNLSASTLEGSVKVSGLSTENKTRDKHLMSDDFFDVEKYPEMKFSMSGIEKSESGYKAKGKLTIKETTKDVTFDVIEKDGGLHFKATIYGLDYGVAVKKKREDSKIYILVKVPLS